MREIRLQPRARQNGRSLQRISQRFFEVAVGDLQVALLGDCRTVADSGTHDVDRILGFQFRLPTGPQVVEDPRPRFESGPFDNPPQLGPEVSSSPIGDDELGPYFGTFKHFFKERPQLFAGGPRHGSERKGRAHRSPFKLPCANTKP